MIFYRVTPNDELVVTDGFLPVKGCDAFSVENLGTSTVAIGKNIKVVPTQERVFDQIIGGKYGDNIPVTFSAGATNMLLVRTFTLDTSVIIEAKK